MGQSILLMNRFAVKIVCFASSHNSESYRKTNSRILVPLGSSYQILAGERRFRAARMIGLSEIPVVIRDATDQEAILLGLVENLQRTDLNPIEKAEGIRSLLEVNRITQEQASKQLGKDRSHIANLVRLLDLPKDVQELVSRGTLSMGHARAILGINDPDIQRKISTLVIRKNLNVRNVEKLVQNLKAGSEWSVQKPQKTKDKPPNVREIEDRISKAIGLKVEIREKKKGKGRIVIHFSSLLEFDSISGKLLK